MKRSTVLRLRALNRTFYRTRAREFDAARQAPWPGWVRVLEPLDGDRPLSVLDVACGNGRFGSAAATRAGDRLRYTGVDASPGLLQVARHRGGPGWRLLAADVLERALPLRATERFDLIGCFGLMHHVPGASHRAELLRALARRLGPGGRLAVSFWQIGDDERLLRRALPWSVVERLTGTRVDPDELEQGDLLLPWGELEDGLPVAAAAVRFCHACDPEEVDGLCAAVPLERVDRFRADGRGGRLNLYVVFRRGD